MREFKVGDKIRMKKTSYWYASKYLNSKYKNSILEVYKRKAGYLTVCCGTGYFGELHDRDWELVIKRNLVEGKLP